MCNELVELPISNKGIAKFMSEFGPTAQPLTGEVSSRVQTNIDNAKGEFMAILNSGMTITEANRNTLATALRYAREQGLISGTPDLSELFIDIPESVLEGVPGY